VNVSLKPALNRFVAAKVESGRYTSASEVVREARTRTAQLAAFNREIGSRLALLERGDTLRTRGGSDAAAAEVSRAEKARGVKQYVLGAGAERDLNEIWEYIAQDSIDAAGRWIAKLFSTDTSLARNPAIGHNRLDLTDHPVLFWPVGANMILYRVRKKCVEIVGVTQGARDIPSFLEHRTQ
jgi:plasmid stabilization system protein ParE/Arc/MetJ-type ribon-helix-helix transcriptional regulator